MAQVAYLALLGGSTVENATRRVLREMFTNQRSVSFNFAGRCKKVGIGDTKIVSAITHKPFFVAL